MHVDIAIHPLFCDSNTSCNCIHTDSGCSPARPTHVNQAPDLGCWVLGMAPCVLRHDLILAPTLSQTYKHQPTQPTAVPDSSLAGQHQRRGDQVRCRAC
jgi:hypothetical protein